MRIIRITIYNNRNQTNNERTMQLKIQTIKWKLQPLLLSIFAGLICTNAVAADSVNVYSYRQPFLIKPIFDAFTEETGIEVNTVFAKKGLVQRLKNEGRNSPADILLTSDFSNLSAAVAADVTAPVTSEMLDRNIPAEFRDPDNLWFGLTNRARLIAVSKDRIGSNPPASYEDLIKPEYQGKICTRSGKHNYMVALTASIIAHNGENAGREWLEGLKANLARKPQGNDRAQVKAISQGECDIAIINSYYMGAMLADEEQTVWANSVNLIFPNQADRGTHMNISGVALTRSAPNKDNAIKLMEFLSSATAQSMYAEVNHEYPVNQSVEASKLVQSWGSFSYDKLPLAKIAEQRNSASKLADEVNYDN